MFFSLRHALVDPGFGSRRLAFSCRAVWPQAESRLLAKYKATEVYDGEWRKYLPDPKQAGFYAVQVPHDFTIHTSYGVMRGKKGDYVLKVPCRYPH